MKNWLYAGIFLAGILIGSVIINVHAQNNPPKLKWEYKIITNGVSKTGMENTLNSLGQDGWELVAALGGVIYLKREAAQ